MACSIGVHHPVLGVHRCQSGGLSSALFPKRLEENGKDVFLIMNTDESFSQVKTQIVTSDLLGKAKMPNAGYENPDGTPLIIDIDYHGKKRDIKNPSAGPFEKPEIGKQLRLKVW